MSSVSHVSDSVQVGEIRRSGIVSDSLVSGLVFALTLTVAQRILGAVRGVLFCRLMTDQQLGQWSMIYSFLLMLAPLAVLGLPGSFGKYVEQYSHSGQLKPFLRQVNRVCCITTLLLASVICIVPGFFSYQVLGETRHIGLMYWMAATLVLLTLLNYLTSLVESLRQIRLVTMMRFLSGISFTVLGILLLVSPLDSSIAAIASFAMSCLIGSVPALWYLKKQRREFSAMNLPLNASGMWLGLAPFAAWWWVSNLLHNAVELVDRYMLVHLGTTSAFEVQGSLGQYHSSRVVPLIMVGVAAMLSGLLLPYVAASWQSGEMRRARQQQNMTIKLTSLGMMFANVVLLATSPLLFEWILQGKYSQGLSILPLTMVYCTWFSIQVVAQDYLWVSEKGKFAVLCMGIGLLGNIVLNWFMIPTWGLWGAVMATTLGNLLGVSTMFLANWRLGCPPDRGCWIGLAFPLVLLAGPLTAIALTLVVSVACLSTRAYFSIDEQRMLRELASGKLGGFLKSR